MSTQNNQVTETAPASTPAAPAPEMSVEDILKFDPFESNASNELNGDSGNAPVEDTSKGADGSDAGQPATQPATPPAPASPAPNPEIDSLQKQVAEARALIEQMQKAGQPAADAKPEAQVDDTPDYLFNIPDVLFEKLGSEDPKDFREGVTATLQGVARSVHKTIMQQIAQVIVPQVIQQSQTSLLQNVNRTKEQNDIRADFYGTYQEFDKPEFYPVISMMATNLANEMKVSGYTPEFKQALATKLKAILNVQKAPQPVVVKQPPTIMGGSATRQAPSEADATQREIMDILSFN